MNLVWIESSDPRYPDWVIMRQRILREPLGLEYSREDLLEEKEDQHLLLYSNKELLGGLIVRPTDRVKVWKIRQVAVSESRRGEGLGRRLMEEAVSLAAQSEIQSLVLHAREDVVRFYEPLGFSVVGESFEEVGIPHRKMVKLL